MRIAQSPRLRMATRLMLAATLLAGGVILDGIFARYYFYANWIRLQTAADAAAIAGANYLPAHPRRALAVAREYAELNGVRSSEIVMARVSPDDREISLRVKRSIPFYLAGAPAQVVSARATAAVRPFVSAPRLPNVQA